MYFETKEKKSKKIKSKFTLNIAEFRSEKMNEISDSQDHSPV